MPLIKHLRVQKNEAQNIIASLRESGELLMNYSITRDDSYIYVPVGEDYDSADLVVMEREETRRNFPKGHAGGFDHIGDIAIIHGRNGGRVESIKDFIIKVKPGIRSIYLDNGIKGEHRLRDLELLHGEDNPETMYRENGLRFKVNVKTAYFSPRLSTERFLLSRRIKDGERIFDMFAGIGTFSINLAASAACNIVSCDINPDAYALMKENIGLNRIKGTVEPINDDSYRVIGELEMFHRIVMNNPMLKYRDLDLIIKHICQDGILNIYYIETVEGIGEVMNQMESMGMVLQVKRIVHGYSRNMFMFSLEYRKVLK